MCILEVKRIWDGRFEMVLVPLSHPYSFVKKLRVNNIEPLPVLMSERRLGI